MREQRTKAQVKKQNKTKQKLQDNNTHPLSPYTKSDSVTDAVSMKKKKKKLTGHMP